MSMKNSNDTIRNRARHLPVEYIKSCKITNLTSFKRFFTKQKRILYVEATSVLLWYHISDHNLCRIFMKFGSGALNDKLPSQPAFSNNGFGGNYYRPTLVKGLNEFLALSTSICINVRI